MIALDEAESLVSQRVASTPAINTSGEIGGNTDSHSALRSLSQNYLNYSDSQESPMLGKVSEALPELKIQLW